MALPFLLSVLLVLFLWDSIVHTVYPGEAGVLYKRLTGTEIEKVYGEGLHVTWPWDKFYIYNVRIQEVKRDFEALSSQGMQIAIKLSIRFRPEHFSVSVLHQRIGPEYVETVVIPEVEATVRKLFGQTTDKEIYTSANAIIDRSLNESRIQLGSKFIYLDDLIIRRLEFPPKVQDAINTKIEQLHLFESYEYRLAREKQEAKRKEIEAQGIKKFQETVSQGISESYLKWRGIEATKELAASPNAKVVIIGNGDKQLPIILGGN